MNARTTKHRLASGLAMARTLVTDGLSLLRVIMGLAVFFHAASGNWGTALFFLLLTWLIDLASIVTNCRWGSLHAAFPSFDGYGLADRWMACVSVSAVMLFVVQTTGSFTALLGVALAYIVILVVFRAGLARMRLPYRSRYSNALTTWFATFFLAWNLLGFLIGLLVFCLVTVAMLYKEKLSRRLDQIEQRG